MTEYHNFKVNVNSRCAQVVDRLDYNMLVGITKNILCRDLAYVTLSDASKVTMLNNVLIFNFTDDIITSIKLSDEFNIEDAIIKSVLVTTTFRNNNMYPTKGDETRNFLDCYRVINDQ